jgi:hypothetical protein
VESVGFAARRSSRASPTVGPIPSDELAMPSKERLGRDHERGPPVPGQRPAHRGEEGPIPVAKLRPTDGAPEHLHLVAEDGVLKLQLRHAFTSGEHP